MRSKVICIFTDLSKLVYHFTAIYMSLRYAFSIVRNPPTLVPTKGKITSFRDNVIKACQNILIFISADLSKLVKRSIFVVTRGVQKSREEVRCLQQATYENETIIKDSSYISH